MENGAVRQVARPQQKKKGSSQFRGVRLRASGKFGAEITIPGRKRRMWLGTYVKEEEAAHAYDHAARKFGFAESRCNFPISGEPPPESSTQGGESSQEIKSDMLLPCQINLNYPPPLF